MAGSWGPYGGASEPRVGTASRIAGNLAGRAAVGRASPSVAVVGFVGGKLVEVGTLVVAEEGRLVAVVGKPEAREGKPAEELAARNVMGSPPLATTANMVIATPQVAAELCFGKPCQTQAHWAWQQAW